MYEYKKLSFMKVLHIGDIRAYALTLVIALREEGIDAELVIAANKAQNFSWAGLKERPMWVHEVKKNRFLTKFFGYAKCYLKTREYDLLHTYSLASNFALFTGKPYISQAMGTDLREYAFGSGIGPMLYRNSLKRANVVLAGSPDHDLAVKELGLKNYRIPPHIIDTGFFSPDSGSAKPKKELVFFCPTMHDWGAKGNDRILLAFAEFIKKNRNARLELVGWGQDLERSKNLAKKLKITDRVDFIGVLDQSGVRDKIRSCDAVIDQFPNIVKNGEMGLIGLQTLSCGIPLISNYETKAFLVRGEETPPVLKAKTSGDILEAMKSLENNETKKRICRQSREWAVKNVSLKKNVKYFIRLYEEILDSK